MSEPESESESESASDSESDSDSESTAALRLPAVLLQPWWAFTADPGDGTADELAQALENLRTQDAELAAKAMGVIAADLGRRSIQDRCAMSLVLAFWPIDATDFLNATAGVGLAHSTMEPP